MGSFAVFVIGTFVYCLTGLEIAISHSREEYDEITKKGMIFSSPLWRAQAKESGRRGRAAANSRDLSIPEAEKRCAKNRALVPRIPPG